MKKTLSLLLVLAMVLSSFGFAFAAEDEIVPAEFLNEKGILKGNAEGNLMLEDNLKRQDMVVMLSRLLGVEEEAKAYEGETTFTDIADPFYVPYIAWAEAEELTEGVGDNKFGFDRAVKENEVAAFLLRALGYTDVKWEDVPAKAVELGLVEKDADLTVDAKREVLAELTYKALGMKMKDSEKTLAEHLEIEMPVPEVLEVKEVVAENLKEIKVVFNKAVDESVYDFDNYETDAGDIEDIVYVEEENMAILSLEDAMDNKEDYEITVKVEELDVNKEFTAIDNAIPEVVDVMGLGTKAVKITMSEPVKDAKTTNFKVDGNTVYGKVDTAGREIVIKLYKTLSVGEHELTVRNLEDFNKFKSLESKNGFEVVEDKDAPVVEDAQATLERAIVTFNEDVDDASVSRYSVYYKNGNTKVYAEDYARLAGNKYAFIFGGEKALPVYETTLYVEGVKDYSGNKMDPAEVAVKPSIDETRPEVIKVEIQDDKKTIAVKFSKSVDEDDAKDIDNYTILDPKDNKQTISEVKKANSRTYEIVLGKALAENKEYTLKISGICDNNKYPNVMLAYEAPLAVGDYTAPRVDYVSGAYTPNYNDDKEIKSAIHVFFTKEMDLGTLSNPENYLVKVNNSNKLLSDVGGDVDIIKSDGTVVLVTVVNKYKVEEIAVLGVKDTTGKKLFNYGVMQPVKAKTFSLESATAETKDEIELEFSLPVAEADINDFKVNGSSSIVKEVEISGANVTLKLDGSKLKADKNQVEILDKEIVAYNDEKLPKIIKDVKDEIAPSIIKATPNYNAGDANVVVTVDFDENIKINDENAARTDIKVVRIEGIKAITDFTIAKNGEDKLDILIPVTNFKDEFEFVDSVIEVSIVEDARFITDVKGNAANEMSERTIKVTGVEDEVVAPATYAVTFVVKAGETVVNDATIVVKKGETVVEPVEGAYKLEAGDYTYTVTKDGYKTVTESFTVESAAKEVSVTLAAESKNKIEVKAKETATGIGRILTVEKTGYEEAVKYLLKNAEGTALNKGGLPADFSVETIVVFEKEGDTVTVELYDVEGNILETLPVVITK